MCLHSQEFCMRFSWHLQDLLELLASMTMQNIVIYISWMEVFSSIKFAGTQGQKARQSFEQFHQRQCKTSNNFNHAAMHERVNCTHEKSPMVNSHPRISWGHTLSMCHPLATRHPLAIYAPSIGMCHLLAMCRPLAKRHPVAMCNPLALHHPLAHPSPLPPLNFVQHVRKIQIARFHQRSCVVGVGSSSNQKLSAPCQRDIGESPPRAP